MRQMLHLKSMKVRRPLSRSLGGMALVAAASVAAASMAFAEARVTGHANALRVEAQDTPLSEVLTALGAKFELRSRSAGDLRRPITGTYEGSVHEIIARVLTGYNYIVKGSGNRLDVIIYGASKAAPNAPAASAVAQNQVTPNKPAPAAAAAATAIVSSNAAPAGVVLPPPPPPNQSPVAVILGNAALSQIPGYMASGGAAAAGTPNVGATADGADAAATPQSNMAAMTSKASAAIQSLQVALSNLPVNGPGR